MTPTTKQPLVTLASGASMPVVGLGTWMSKEGEVHAAVKHALKTGYRHIDTAHIYGNHAEIGQALKECIAEGVVARSEVFVTSKVWNTYHSYDRAIEAVDVLLRELQLDYLDLVLIHWPMGYKEGADMFPKNEDGTAQWSDVDWMDTWKALQASVKAGKVRSIGVSNFNIAQVQRVVEFGGDVPCSMLQVELHPYFPQSALVAKCRANKIHVTAYSPLANNAHIFRKDGDRNLLDEPALREIAAKHKKTPAQVVIRWFVQQETVVIPKSVTPSRIVENLAVFDFVLDTDDLAAIASLATVNWRILKLEVVTASIDRSATDSRAFVLDMNVELATGGKAGGYSLEEAFVDGQRVYRKADEEADKIP